MRNDHLTNTNADPLPRDPLRHHPFPSHLILSSLVFSPSDICEHAHLDSIFSDYQRIEYSAVSWISQVWLTLKYSSPFCWSLLWSASDLPASPSTRLQPEYNAANIPTCKTTGVQRSALVVRAGHVMMTGGTLGLIEHGMIRIQRSV